MAGEHQSASGSQTYGCGESSAGGHGLGPGRSRVVATVQRTFTAPGRYTLTFRLNQIGQRMVAQLANAERAYRSQHPHGKAPPTLAFGVSLDYTSPTS